MPPRKSKKPSRSPKRRRVAGKTGGRQSSDHCGLCRSPWDSPNPIVKGQSTASLPRCKGYGDICDVCTGTLKFGYKGVSKADIEEKLKSPGGQTEFGLVRKAYVDKRNGEVFVHFGKVCVCVCLELASLAYCTNLEPKWLRIRLHAARILPLAENATHQTGIKPSTWIAWTNVATDIQPASQSSSQPAN